MHILSERQNNLKPLFWDRALATFFLSALTIILVGKVFQAVDEIYHLPLPSGSSQRISLSSVNVNPAWIISGTPNFRGAVIASSLDGKRSTGVWECDGPTVFEWHFGYDETVYILEGQVEIEYLENKITLNAGDTAVFHAGTKAIWRVPKHLKKTYVTHEPEILVRVYRKLIAFYE